MNRIKGKNTKPELLVRKFLFANGFRYRLNVKNLPGKPDIVLSNTKKRDLKAEQELKDLGWRTIMVWTCELKNNKKDTTLSKLLREIYYI